MKLFNKTSINRKINGMKNNKKEREIECHRVLIMTINSVD